jgi:hypothetical protein
MADPRNTLDKKVQQGRKHRGGEIAPAGHAVQPGKKPHLVSTDAKPETDDATPERSEQIAG